MAQTRTYAAYGLVIRSDIELPLQAVAPAPADVTISHDPQLPVPSAPLDRRAPDVIASLGDDDDPWYVASPRGQRVSFNVRRTAQFELCAVSGAISWRGHPDADGSLVPILLSGTVLSLFLILRHELVLHASAVAIDDEALAFVGHSGRGKSTMAALGVAAGATAIADDVLVVDTADEPRCCGNGGELRLRPAAAPLSRSLPVGTGERWTTDERLSVLPSKASTGWVDLRAIIVPRPSREVDEVSARRVKPAVAALWLISFPRVNGLTPAAILRGQLEKMSHVCARVPVYDMTVPWGPPFPPDVFEAVYSEINTDISGVTSGRG